MSRRVLQFFEPAEGGVPEHVRVLALGLARRGWDVELLGPLSSHAYEAAEEVGLEVHRLGLGPGLGRPWEDLRQLRPCVRRVRVGAYDLVHCHSAKAGVFGRLAGLAARVPVVYSPHAFPFLGDIFSRRRRAFAWAVERALSPATAAVVCVCEYERRLAASTRLGPPDRFALVRYGAPPCGEDGEDAQLSEFARGGPTAAVVAALRPQKAIETFVDAAPAVLAAVPAARLAVVGDGPEREMLRERARRTGLLDDPRFAFLRFRPPSSRYLRSIDLYVLPSSWEALPIGVLEALACGVPQVATDVGGTGEAVSCDTGILVPARDAAALAAAIVELLSDEPRRRAMAAASRRRHTAEFGQDAMVDRMAALYERTIAASGPRR